MWGLVFDTTTIAGTNRSRSSIMETMPHCYRCPSRKQSLAICSNSESNFDPTPTASPIATTRSHLASQLFCGIIAVTFVLALLVVVVVILVILVVVLADCATIVFKNKIKMVLAIADSLEW